MVIGLKPSEPGIDMPHFMVPPACTAPVAVSEAAPITLSTAAAVLPPLLLPPHAATIAPIEASDSPSTVPR